MFSQITDADFKEKIAATADGVLLCFKKLCPHCKNMEKVLEKFATGHTGVTFLSLDSEENPTAMKELEAERAPTIFVIKGGKVAARKAGLMNPREMNALYTGAK